MAENKRCHLGECNTCMLNQPINFGNFLFDGSRTLSARNQYKPQIEELTDVISKDDHIIPLPELVERLETDLEEGLKEEQVKSIRERFGRNVISEGRKLSRWSIFICRFRSSFFLLFIGIIVCFTTTALPSLRLHGSFAYDNMYLGFVMLIMGITSICIFSTQEQKIYDQMALFKYLYPQYASVIRDGKKMKLHRRKIVVGDLVHLKAGCIVPADIRVTESWSLTVDELPLICRTEPVSKTPNCTNRNPTISENVVFYGTLCTNGHGQGIAIATGNDTLYAHFTKKTVVLQKTNTVIYNILQYIIRANGAVTFLVGAILLGLSTRVEYLWTNALILILVQIIASMPDILYSTITANLSLAAKNMACHGCLPKDYEAVETMGSTTVICCDKTGTITQNRMTVIRLFLEDKLITVEHSEDRSKMILNPLPSDETWNEFFRAACLCSTVSSKARRNRCVIRMGCSCDQTEIAIMEFIQYYAGNGTTENVNSTREKYRKVFEIPFSAYRMNQLTIHETKDLLEHDCSYLLCMKGGIEIIMKACSTVFMNGKDEPISALDNASFHTILKRLLEEGDRIIAFCDLQLRKDEFPHGYSFKQSDIPESGFRFLGFVSILDPPRPSVPEAIAKCKAARIKVILMTGDHPITGKAIAKKIGIISPNSQTPDEVANLFSITPEEVTLGSAQAIIVTGSELKSMNLNDLRRILNNYKEIVFARITPRQKMNIVKGLHADGEVVALTGDSAEDCPAMREADIGIGMGMHGCDASRDSANVILLGDNFTSIVTGIEEGRAIFDNLRKATAYVLSSNVPEITPYIMVCLLQIPLPIGAIFILFIILMAETFPVLFLAQEKPEDDIMKRNPLGPQKPFDARIIQKSYYQIGVIGLVSGLLAYFMVMAQYGFLPKYIFGIKRRWDSHAINDLTDSFNQEWTYSSRKQLEYTCQTAYFITIIVLQWFNIALSRTRRRSPTSIRFNNLWLVLSVFIETLVIVFLMYTPGFSTAFHIYPLKFTSWLMCLPFGIFLLAYEELRRYLIRYSTGDSWLDKETF